MKKVFGILFILLAISIPLNRAMYFRPYTNNEARTIVKDISTQAGVYVSDDIVEKLVFKTKLTSPIYYYPHRVILSILFISYMLCSIAIFLNRKIIYRIIVPVFWVRILYQFIQIFGYYMGYRIPFVVLGMAEFPIPPIDSDLMYRLFYYGSGILFSIFGIVYFIRPKVKEQFK